MFVSLRADLAGDHLCLGQHQACSHPSPLRNDPLSNSGLTMLTLGSCTGNSILPSHRTFFTQPLTTAEQAKEAASKANLPLLLTFLAEQQAVTASFCRWG